MHGRLPARDLHHVRLPFVTNDCVDQPLHVIERPVLVPRRTAAGVADGTLEVAAIGNLHERQARVLLMIGAKPAVVRAAPADRRVERQRHLGRFDEDLTAPAVVLDVVRHQHPLEAVRRTPLEHEDRAVLEHDLPFDLPKAGRADRDGHVVEEVGAHAISHGAPPLPAAARAERSTPRWPDIPTESRRGHQDARPA
jgi:hypothetical protein